MRPKIKTPDTPFVPSDALIASWGGRRIIFIGYMGAGKTTIGRQLALSLGQTFYDLDWYIESRMRRTAKQLFDERGEEGFRKVEHNMLHEVAEFEDVVISCGGGAPCFYDNMDYLNRQGATVYLKAEPDVLYGHLKMGRVVRPLLLNKTTEEVREFIHRQLAEREPLQQGQIHLRRVAARQLRKDREHRRRPAQDAWDRPIAKRTRDCGQARSIKTNYQSYY